MLIKIQVPQSWTRIFILKHNGGYVLKSAEGIQVPQAVKLILLGYALFTQKKLLEGKARLLGDVGYTVPTVPTFTVAYMR